MDLLWQHRRWVILQGISENLLSFELLVKLCKDFGKFIMVEEEVNAPGMVQALLGDCDLTKVPHIISLSVEGDNIPIKVTLDIEDDNWEQ